MYYIRNMKTITLKQIAEELNISVTTVSKALKGYSDVSKKTKKQVKELAKKLNYIPNASAVNLRTQQTKTIGVIVPTTVHHFFATVIKGIIKTAKKRDYMVILLQSEEDAEQEIKSVDLLISKGVDGIMISLSNKTQNFDHLEKIKNHDIPLVLFDKISKITDCSKVVINDQKAAYDAVEYLIKKGYKRIAHFRGDLNPQVSIDRFLGYKKALLNNNIEFDSSLVYICNNNDDFNDGHASAKKLIDMHGKNVDALFAITDMVAIGALKYFNDHGIKIPKDIAIIGFSNWFMSSVITPTLTTIDQPGYKMGKTAFKLLYKEIKTKNVDISYETIEMKTSLIVREST
ncbi:LacI family DNA-binding transcriptional regulator [Flavivirga jejuensis]|uniref:LacI family DNA-binding transcriptional regulator n=1 Tax=Flavivirga jejuensis TaxID=870487 RepID=A0ABT8WNR1_9FLAO|nr:LacI family DNA-binding transcriptional regulator [Flavivirga jejuensis]MDO5974650.1 LacI family DNA-binding transcriptional regulator [Flavivirga jejuensis]